MEAYSPFEFNKRSKSAAAMHNLYWPFAHRVLTCEIFDSITIKHIDRAFLEPPRLVLYTQRYQHQILIHEIMEIVPHTFEWRALIDSASQFADSYRLEQFVQWLIEEDQPQRRNLFFTVL